MIILRTGGHKNYVDRSFMIMKVKRLIVMLVNYF